MKQVTSILKMFSLALLIVGGTACTGNFDDINRKDYEVDKNELGRENYNLGATLRGLQGLVVPTKEHLYQFIEALAAGRMRDTSEPPTHGQRSSRLTIRPLTGRTRLFLTSSQKPTRSTATCWIRVTTPSHWHLPSSCV